MSNGPSFSRSQRLIIIVASIGFLFDTYELLMTPLTAPAAITEFLNAAGVPKLDIQQQVTLWTGRLLWITALCGGGWFLGGLCDVAENFAVARLLDRYPQVDGGNVAFASAMTRLKLVLFALGVVGALAAAYLVFKPLAG